MNESIIRRFAKYHGIAPPPNGNWTIEYIRYARSGMEEQWRHPGAIEQARERLIQTLTRIEDAEMLAWSMSQDKPRVVQNALDLERCALLLRAGVNPEKWDGVKE